MKIGVTGGRGFIGGHLVKHLLTHGYSVVVVDNFRRPQHQLQSHPLLKEFKGDIRHFEDLSVLADCDVLINLAAEASVMRAESDPQYTWECNALAVHSLVTFCLENDIHLIQASSREVYGEVPSLPVAEDSPHNAKNIYGKSKVEAESILKKAKKSNDLKASILRFSNVIGTHDSGRLLPLWLKAASQNEQLIVYGGQQVLDLVPVEFVISVLLFVIENGPIETMNVGSGVATSIMELARRIQTIYPDIKITTHPARSSEVVGFQSDIKRLLKLGLVPPPDPLENLEQLAQFYSSAP